MFQIVDIIERYHGNEHHVMVIGRTKDDQVRLVNVRNTPLSISVAIGDNFQDMDSLVYGLNKHLINSKIRCRKFGCRCGNDKLNIYREDCKVTKS